MRRLIPALAIFVALHGPNGRDVYIVKSQVVAIVAPVSGECDNDSHAKVYTMTLTVCVSEDVDDVAHKVADPD